MGAPKVPAGWELEEPAKVPDGWELEQPEPAVGVPGSEPDASMGESALQGYAQGASFGMADELAGVAHQGVKTLASGAGSLAKTAAGRAALRHLFPGLRAQPDMMVDAAIDEGLDQGAEQVLGSRSRSSGGKGLEGAGYSMGRDQARSDVKQAQESNPKTFFAGNLAGAMSVPLPGGAAKPFQTVIGRSLQNAGKFGAAGAAQGFGSSDADLLKGEFGQLAEDTAIGGGIGAGMGAVTGPAAYLWARKARPALQSLANSRAVAAIAPSAGLLNRLRKSGVRSEDDIQRLGSEILDSKILRPLGTAASSKSRNDALMAFEGANIGATMEKADDLVTQGVALPPSRDVQRQLVTQSLAQAADTPAARATMPAVRSKLLQNVGDDVPRPDNFPSSFRELWKNKSQLQSVLKADEFSNLGQKLYRKGVGGYTRGVYNQVEGALGPDDVAKLRESAKRYGTAAKVDDFLTEQTTRKAVNQPIGVGDMARGVAFEGVTPGGSAVGTLISALMRGRVDSTLATGANALSKVRPNLPDPLLKGASEGVRLLWKEERPAAAAKLKDDEEAINALINGG